MLENVRDVSGSNPHGGWVVPFGGQNFTFLQNGFLGKWQEPTLSDVDSFAQKCASTSDFAAHLVIFFALLVKCLLVSPLFLFFSNVGWLQLVDTLFILLKPHKINNYPPMLKPKLQSARLIYWTDDEFPHVDGYGCRMW